MATKITWDDKENLETKPEVATKNKVTADDINAIKTSVNEVIDEMVVVYSGTAEPTTDIGKDGDIYILLEEEKTGTPERTN